MLAAIKAGEGKPVFCQSLVSEEALCMTEDEKDRESLQASQKTFKTIRKRCVVYSDCMTQKQKRTVEVNCYILGADVVLTKDNGEYITTMKNGVDNKRVKNGRRIR